MTANNGIKNRVRSDSFGDATQQFAQIGTDFLIMQLAHAKLDHGLASARTCAAELNYSASDGVGCFEKINVGNFVIFGNKKCELNNGFLDGGKRIGTRFDRVLNLLQSFHLFLPLWICIDRFFIFGKIRDRGFQLGVEWLSNHNGRHTAVFRICRRTVCAQRLRDFSNVLRFATI